MTQPLRLLVHGASGRMGRAILRLCAADPRMVVVAAITQRGDAVAEAGDCTVMSAAHLSQCPDFDVAIDFSLPNGFDAILSLCRQRGAALVSGTTGLSVRQQADLAEAAGEIAVVWSANFSLGVALLTELVRQAAAALPGWDVDIVESHHRHKQDAPSGTALHLGAAVMVGRGVEPHYASLRAGDIVGEHFVQFAGEGERVELIHRAGSRDIFARGALEAACRISTKPAGLHPFGQMVLEPIAGAR